MEYEIDSEELHLIEKPKDPDSSRVEYSLLRTDKGIGFSLKKEDYKSFTTESNISFAKKGNFCAFLEGIISPGDVALDSYARGGISPKAMDERIITIEKIAVEKKPDEIDKWVKTRTYQIAKDNAERKLSLLSDTCLDVVLYDHIKKYTITKKSSKESILYVAEMISKNLCEEGENRK